MSGSTPPVALTIAGSDPSGGAGIQADLTTFAAHGVHGTSVITALTAQNTVGVQGVAVTEVEFVAAQLASVLDDLTVAAVKTGMLATEEIVRLVADQAAKGRLPNLVVDPVMVASTGARLLSEGAERAYAEGLLPSATIITPNLREATVLLGLGRPLTTARDIRDHADALQALCPGGWVVVTGGHATPEAIAAGGAVDLALHDGDVHELAGSWVDTDNDHGTGCTFAAATAARLARGDDPLTAIEAAKAFVAQQIRRSAGWRLGHGRGPVAHTSD
jgi:hydroxymethylpyrimidine/phosphomethylpyrimidine kinase